MLGPQLDRILELFAALYAAPIGIQDWALLALRFGVGVFFVLHGYPKLVHLQQWSRHLKMPVYLCFLSAASMFLGGFCLILGLLTPFACLAILSSMVVALALEVMNGIPLVASDPYLIPAGEYEGASGKGEPPSQEKALMYSLVSIALLAFGPGGLSFDAWLLNLLTQ